jgi:hypothetical protein
VGVNEQLFPIHHIPPRVFRFTTCMHLAGRYLYQAKKNRDRYKMPQSPRVLPSHHSPTKFYPSTFRLIRISWQKHTVEAEACGVLHRPLELYSTTNSALRVRAWCAEVERAHACGGVNPERPHGSGRRWVSLLLSYVLCYTVAGVVVVRGKVEVLVGGVVAFCGTMLWE